MTGHLTLYNQPGHGHGVLPICSQGFTSLGPNLILLGRPWRCSITQSCVADDGR